jgi:exodeoxyribonuclease V beta subunit
LLSIWTDTKPVKKGCADDRLPVMVAAQIAQLLASGATMGGRALVPSDIAVLVARNAQAHRMQVALRAMNIPSVLLGNASVFKTVEAAELRAVLAAIATPSREPFLRAALATALLGASAATLDALVADARAWESRLLRFQQYHEEWRAHGFIRMFRRLLRDEEVRVRLLGFPDGERRLTNVLHIAELLHCASVEHRLGISGLLKWLADRCGAAGVVAEEHELRLETDRDAVHVVTMHKSKGLEYNIVFCPYFWRAAELFNSEPLVFHDPANGHRAVLDLARTPANVSRAMTERLAEDLRLLYVAVTRARYRCVAVWGQFNQCENSAANWLLHGGGPEAELDPEEFAGWVKVLPPSRFDAAAEAFAASSENAVRIEPLPSEQAAVASLPSASLEIHEPRAFRRSIPRDWRIASFSSLTAGEDAEQPDFDRIAATAQTDEAIVAEGIHAFPRGPKAGVCLHQIFETIDFRGETEIGARLASFGYDRPELHAAVATCVRNTLTTVLPPGFALESIPRSAQLREVEFTFPFSRIEARELASIFGEVPLRAGALHFEPQRGFLRGFIDLIVEHAGRFYLIDWKSNWLGAHGASYTPQAIEEEMLKHHYRLQYYIYTAALDRFLRWRAADYAFETHFGGVFYLFLRGIDPTVPGRGVFYDRPDAETVSNLNALFARDDSLIPS